MKNKLRKVIENKLEEEQAGFRPGRQTQDHIFTLKTLIGQKIEKNRKLDLRAAFDSNCKQKTERTQIGFWNLKSVHIQVLLYADDLVLIAVTEEKLQNCVTEWGDELTRKEMEKNVKKSKVMCIAKEGLQNITINDGRYDEEILNKRRKANAIYYQFNKTIVGKKEVTIKTKMQLYQSVLVSTSLYGVKRLPWQDKYARKIQASEMKYVLEKNNK
ncbi:hypothetical protein J437_LFUL001758 [Ladona fulva]|uniref:Reverse transcriptase domain-containing protein n=1 Tax=Ladona fulva TaxID=123851 RepID=A0A8K0JVW7_LADFU|nr:hypothetical protein J437_LFUL001758 [Ladona fulva]